jgi:hypothetical protein
VLESLEKGVKAKVLSALKRDGKSGAKNKTGGETQKKRLSGRIFVAMGVAPPEQDVSVSTMGGDGEGGAESQGNGGSVASRSSLPLHAVHSLLPLGLGLKLVGCGSAVAMGAVLSQGLNPDQAVLLLLEVHRRGAAAPVVEYLANTVPG